MNMRHYALLAGVAVLVSACAPGLKRINASIVQPPDVVLTVQGSPRKLDITTPGMPGCKPAHQGKGCLNVKQNDSAVFTFKLAGSPDWNLTWFMLCYGDSKPTGDTCTLHSPTNLEFIVKADGKYYQPDLATGRVTFPAGDDIDEFLVFDNNWTQQDYYYVIQACQGVGPPCLETDPIIENDGSTISNFAW